MSLRTSDSRSRIDSSSLRTDASLLSVVLFFRGIVVQLANGKHRVYLKGASEILLKMSTKHLIVSEAPIKSEEIEVATFDEETRQNIDNTIILYANNVSFPLRFLKLAPN